MKALIYKEFKLAMHPICYVFVAMFPLMVLIPSYPLAIGFIYVLTCYPILFLGANKGQQSNDLLYSTLLPVRKKDIVLARIITVVILQFAFMAIMSALYPVALMINNSIVANGTSEASGFTAGLDLSGFVSVLGFAVIGYALADLIFFPIYYHHGKSIVLSTLMTILGFITYLGIFTIALPLIFKGYYDFFCGEIWIQLVFFGAALAAYVAIHFVVYKLSSKELERVDF